MVAVLVAGWAHAAGDEPPARVAIFYGQAERYEIVAEGIEERLRRDKHELISIVFPASGIDEQRHALNQLRAFRPTIIAAGGTTATVKALSAVSDVPVVFFMVPNALDAPFLSEGGAGAERVTGVAAGADPADQARGVRALTPEVHKLAVLSGPRTQQTVEAIRAAGREIGLQVLAIYASRTEFPKAIEALDAAECDGVLMVPDADVYNADTVRRLLLWGVRQKKPVWSFTGNVVKAGALAGLQADPDAVAAQAVTLIESVIAGTPPKRLGLQYTNRVEHSVNTHTARMIGVSIERWNSVPRVTRHGEH